LAVWEKDLKVMADAVGPLERLLAEIPAGRRVRITGHRGGRMLRARLLAMGLNLGREVEVIQNNRGLIIVGVNGGRVALGRGISHKILTEPVVPLLTDQRSG
jgi:Fe2+ transport system protein FeoA